MPASFRPLAFKQCRNIRRNKINERILFIPDDHPGLRYHAFSGDRIDDRDYRILHPVLCRDIVTPSSEKKKIAERQVAVIEQCYQLMLNIIAVGTVPYPAHALDNKTDFEFGKIYDKIRVITIPTDCYTLTSNLDLIFRPSNQ